MLDPLGVALGRCLARKDGLQAAYLPPGVPADIAVSMVAAANETRAEVLPYAILVAADAVSTDAGHVPAVSPQDALRYRSGNRLVVIPGKHPDLESFVKTFRSELNQNFPATAASGVGLREVAHEFLLYAFNLVGVQPDQLVGLTQIEEMLEACMRQLMLAHQALDQTTEAWNAYWFRHVAHGLEDLIVDLERAIEDRPDEGVAEFFSRAIYPAFALPRPSSGRVLRPKSRNAGTDIARAVSDWWSDTDSIQHASKALAHHPDTVGATHPMEDVDWSDFGRTLAAEENALLAFFAHERHSNARARARQALTEEQFFNPVGQIEVVGLKIAGANDEELVARDLAGPFLVPFGCLSADPHRCIESVDVRIEVPTVGEIDKETLARSSVTVTSSSRRISWSGAPELLAGGELVLLGTLQYRVAAGDFSYKPQVTSLSLSISPADPLAGLVVPGSSCQLVLLGPAQESVLVFNRKSTGALGSLEYVGPQDFTASGEEMDPRERYELELKGTQACWVAAVGVVPSETPTFNGTAMSLAGDMDAVWAEDLQASQSVEVAMDSCVFSLRRTESPSNFHSPVLAAVHRALVSEEGPGILATQSLPALLERRYESLADSVELMHALGHIAMPLDKRATLEDLTPVASGALLAPRGIAEKWDSLVSLAVPDELVNSEQAARFRAAFEALNVGSVMSRRARDSAESPPISQSSWRHLWNDRDLLAEYLVSYRLLVTFAKALGQPGGIFWATYPLSCSVWDTSAGKCAAILLSPLHPLRLTWLAATEAVLWDADTNLAGQLAGTLEGWNFPLIGPRDTSGGRLMAVPIDAGPGQVFLGWSMMVKASIDGAEALVAPDRIGDFPGLGVSSSGLNAPAVRAALKTYRRINPQVSTITLDLAATSPSPRLPEVDAALIGAMRDWFGTNSRSLRGGVRVWDSLNRQGEAPRQALSDLVRSDESTPILWARYEHDPIVSQVCNIRLLQDSGLRVEVKQDGDANTGLVGEAPLRRFEVPTTHSAASGAIVTKPAIRPDNGWEPFAGALAEVESANLRPQIEASLFGTLLADGRADWTVTGDSLVSPNAMSQLVAAAGDGGQMLWEWRPPFLDVGNGQPQLENRSFLSVVRVPASFRSHLEAVLANVLEGHRASAHLQSADLADRVLENLGARGVGLSSLIAIGGTHATGALGFDLTLALLDAADDSSADQIVLPIDASDGFLKALATQDSHGETQRRADLLVARLTDRELVFVPIEIKFYGLGAEMPNPHLPLAGDHRLTEPLAQLGSTTALLARVADQAALVQGDPDSADSVLWRTGLCTLIEAGLKLRPRAIGVPAAYGDTATRLEDLLKGKIPIRIGKPIVAFYSHKSQAPSGEMSAAFTVSDSADGSSRIDIGVFAANPGAAYEGIAKSAAPVVRDWVRTVEWAFSARGDGPAVEANRRGHQELGQEPLDEAGNETVGRTEAESASVDNESKDQSPEQASTPSIPTESHIASLQDDGVRFKVGKLLSSLGDSYAEFWPANTALNQVNVGVVGDLGTGKTQLLKTLVFGLRSKAASEQPTPVSMLIFDYKRDFQDEGFLSSVGGQVLNATHIPLNIFALNGPYTKLAAFQRASAVIDILSKIYSGIGPVQRDRLTSVIMDIFEEQEGSPPTLGKVLDRYKEESGIDAVTGILTPFVLGEVFSDDAESVRPFGELLNDRVLVLALSDLGADTKAKNALVVLFLSQYFDYMLSLPKWPYQGADPQLRRLNSFLLVDEATNIMKYEFPVLMDLMLQGREFGVGVILASQYLSHFKVHDTNYGEPLLTWFVHKVPHVTAKELSALGMPEVSADDAQRITTLGVHEAFYMSLNFPGRLIRGTPYYELQADETLIDPS